MAPTPQISAVTPPSSLWQRFSSFVADKKTLVYSASAAAIVIVTGAGIYYVKYQDKPASPPAGKRKLTKTEKRKLKKERDREAAKEKKAAEEKQEAAPAKAGVPEVDLDTLATLTDKQREEYSAQFKSAGNDAFNSKSYEAAIDLYTKAIECKPNAVYFSNRAACYNAVGNWEKVVEDTTSALALEPEYLKALTRRANAYEKLEDFSESVLDFTAACILSEFSNSQLSTAVERVLKKSAERSAKDLVQTRERKLPSVTFVTAYLDSFRKRAIAPELAAAAEGTGNFYLKQGLEALEAHDMEGYNVALAAFDKAVELKADDLALAYEMRATFRFLVADNEGAMTDLLASLELKPSVQAYVKRASLHMELGNPVAATNDFDEALKLDADSPDVYYHRGQVRFILSDFAKAAEDYQKSIKLDQEFASSHIQLAVAQYKLGQVATSMATFRRCVKAFPTSSDVFNYYGELLLDQQKFDDALEKFNTAIDIELAKTSGHNVLPLINKAQVLFQTKKDVEEAEKLTQRALELDPQCDIAVATLAQLQLQQGRVKEAVYYFDKQIDMARTEQELIQALCYAEAVRTQLKLQEKYPQFAEKLYNMGKMAA
ncbi:uncharacterized protein V1510DRAFT_416890 [Dipodascopsis tothii]|uniref:uncharacterized protein n=1 Tax=Dipodascopsis tothii TaxID=44089 RepID=UPI0034CD0BB2